MPLNSTQVGAACRELLGEGPRLPLEDYLAAIPRLASLVDVPSGSPVLIRGDVDAKPGPKVGDGDIRLRSMVPTLEYGRSRGWKQIVFGHIGRKPEGSLAAVAKRLGELLTCNIRLVADWFDEKALTVSESALQAVAESKPGDVLVLENTRRYALERLLWDAQVADLDRHAEPLAKFAHAFSRLGKVYVNEAFSAGSLDASTTVVPLAMDRVALGTYVAEQFDGPMRRCLATSLVVFSGLKTDKLDDLQAMIDRGTIELVFAAGSLAMALKKGAAELDGGSFGLGKAENPANAKEAYFISRERVDQARGMIAEGRKRKIEFVLPVDFVLQDGRVAETIGPDDQQFDIGPKTSDLFAEWIGQFIARRGKSASAGPAAVAFHNGVFGMFEDPRFEEGTKRFIGQLKRLTDAGIEVYVGGGEGGTALEKYGQPNWITHCFTAGGTVLNALGSNPVPYLQALRLAAKRG